MGEKWKQSWTSDFRFIVGVYMYIYVNILHIYVPKRKKIKNKKHQLRAQLLCLSIRNKTNCVDVVVAVVGNACPGDKVLPMYDGL